MKATHFHENATYSNSCICCLQPVHRFHLGIPAWDLLLIGCQAPGPLSGRPPQEMGARPQVLFFWKASTKNGCQAPGHSFGKAPPKMGKRPQGILPGDQQQSKNNPEKSQKITKSTQKEIFGENMKRLPFFGSQDATSKSRCPLQADPKKPWGLVLG